MKYLGIFLYINNIKNLKEVRFSQSYQCFLLRPISSNIIKKMFILYAFFRFNTESFIEKIQELKY